MAKSMNSLEYESVASPSDVELETGPKRVRRLARSSPLFLLSFSAMIAASMVLWLVLLATGRKSSTSPIAGSNNDIPGEGGTNHSDPSDSGAGDEKDTPSDLPYPSCDFECQDHHQDRIGHESHLLRGQALCSAQFRFGLSKDGGFFWKDCETEETTVFVTQTDASYWNMKDDGTFQLVNSDTDTVVWEKKPNRDIYPSPTCLHKPLLDCPYIHLHKNGDVVLNSINHDTGKWMDLNANRAYDNLFD
jgi:hypothetical protein